MKVYVVMGNDYPECVYDNEYGATAFCKKMKQLNEDQMTKFPGSFRPIYWRWYEFEVKE